MKTRNTGMNVSNSSSLISIAKSLERIAESLGELKEAFLMEHRMKLKESRKVKRKNVGMITEGLNKPKKGKFDGKTPLENIHSILSGEHIS